MTPEEKKAKRRAWHVANRESEKRKMREKRLANPARALFDNAKKRARKQGIPFSLTLEDIIVPNFCPILGIALKVNINAPGFDSPSIDKIVPELGYVKGNIIVISNKANMIKSNATTDEIRSVADFYDNLKRQKKVLSD